jgi:light-regulated signal transduction histidine kinase (bacteriophytochrome)
MTADAPSSDLDACDQEPIRWPGAIQPHGRMLVLDAQALQPVAASAGWAAHERAALLGAVNRTALSSLPAGGAGSSPISLGRLQLPGGPAQEVSAHRTPTHVIVECEDAGPEDHSPAPIYALARNFLPRMHQARDLPALCLLAAEEMRRLSGFGRALVYRFDEDGHGEVLAETLEDGYDSYLGHHFPASDIPRQARALYLLNHFRLIPDARYAPVPLLGLDASAPAEIDLSQAFLRSVSPVHLEYMRNMGTLASMSVSIVVDGQLWGLVSCHNHAPRTLPLNTRAACEHLGQLLSLQIGALLAAEEAAERLELRQLTLSLVAQLAESDGTLSRLVHSGGLLRLAQASGAAVVLDDAVWTVGETPPPADVEALARWVVARGEEVHASDALALEYEGSAALRETVAGVLAVSISQVHRHVILWFRPEIVRTVRWAGNPRKSVDEQGRIQPRKSFDSWVERIGGRSARWRASELAAARELREALIGIVLRRAQEVADAATALSRVNKELEAFSYTVSHDLRAPMRHIAGYADLVLEMDGAQVSERGRRYLGHVKEAAAFAGQLVDALLDFSRLGRAALKPRSVDAAAMVGELVRELQREELGRRVQWDVAANLPPLYADPFLLQAATRNLLANAQKYTREQPTPHIAVRAVVREDATGLEVQDNGVGFDMKYADKLFGVFQRLHAAEEFEGTGIGLANVKRIVERHGGEVWARGTPQQGAVFGFVLPRPPIR